jgi:hypothetical protein
MKSRLFYSPRRVDQGFLRLHPQLPTRQISDYHGLRQIFLVTDAMCRHVRLKCIYCCFRSILFISSVDARG